MKFISRQTTFLLGLLIALCLAVVTCSYAEDGAKLSALIIDGQNNHAWKVTTPILQAALESSGLFTVTVATTPPTQENLETFKPDFSKYNVIVFNYNGAEWSPATKTAFEEYMKNGGGMVSVHAADNSFPGWLEYNKMIGVGGWGNRNASFGPMLRWRDGKIVRDTTGGGGTHGAFFPWVVEVRDSEHPITKGLPTRWLHTPDELYATLVGPAENVTVLATAQSDVTKQNEPILMAIDYGKGRVFHTTMGHNDVSMKDVAFVTTLNRGAEWAATGKVTQKIPADFPSDTKTSVWTPTPAK